MEEAGLIENVSVKLWFICRGSTRCPTSERSSYRMTLLFIVSLMMKKQDVGCGLGVENFYFYFCYTTSSMCSYLPFCVSSSIFLGFLFCLLNIAIEISA